MKYLIPPTNRTYLRDGRAPIPEKENISIVMSSIRAKNTKPEMNLRNALCKNKLYGYRLHLKSVPGQPDIAYTKVRIAIFVNGCFWHRCPHCDPPLPKTHIEFWSEKFKRNVERDTIKNQELERQGWKVLVFWECEINSNIQYCIEQVMLTMNQRNQ